MIYAVAVLVFFVVCFVWFCLLGRDPKPSTASPVTPHQRYEDTTCVPLTVQELSTWWEIVKQEA